MYYELVLNGIKDIDFTKLNNVQIKNILKNIFSKIFKDFEVKEMYRMTRYTKLNIANNKALLLNNDTKKYFMNTGDKANDVEFKEKKWKKFKYIIDSQMVYFVPDKERIATLAFTSDVCGSGANIVVSTNKENRNKGYGKMAVALLVNSILEKEFLPIYFVNINNTPSINLAKSLGFESMAFEIVVCKRS